MSHFSIKPTLIWIYISSNSHVRLMNQVKSWSDIINFVDAFKIFYGCLLKIKIDIWIIHIWRLAIKFKSFSILLWMRSWSLRDDIWFGLSIQLNMQIREKSFDIKIGNEKLFVHQIFFEANKGGKKLIVIDCVRILLLFSEAAGTRKLFFNKEEQKKSIHFISNHRFSISIPKKYLFGFFNLAFYSTLSSLFFLLLPHFLL